MNHSPEKSGQLWEKGCEKTSIAEPGLEPTLEARKDINDRMRSDGDEIRFSTTWNGWKMLKL